MGNLQRDVKDIKRFNQIVGILAEEGFGYFLGKLNLGNKEFRAQEMPQKNVRPEVRLRRLLERLGPTFIKLGQVLSVRPDLIPASYAKELEKLLDRVPPFTFEEVQEIIEHEFGKNISEVFKIIDKHPIASASISQVHRATLVSGEEVVVKVQRPNITSIMETDIDIMFLLAGLIEKHIPKLRNYQPVAVVREFKTWTEKELDFQIEGRNAARFYRNFAKSQNIKIPIIYDKFTTQKVLVMEYIDGIELTRHKDITALGIDFETVMKNGLDAVLTMVFVHGLFHADPHPGNILVTRDGKLAFVDFGIVGHFNEKLKHKCIDMVFGIVEQDVDLVVDTLMSMGFDTSQVDVDEFKQDIKDIIDDLQFGSIKEVRLSAVLERVIELPLKHKFRIPSQFVLFGKTIVTLEGVALDYDPEFKVVEATRPFVEKLMTARAHPLYLFKTFVHNMNRYKKLADGFPEKAEKVLDNVAQGRIKVDVKDIDIENLAFEIDKSSNRLTYGLVIAALLMTAAITIYIEKGPKIMDVPVISVVSFGCALILGFILFVSIMQEKKFHVKI